VRTRISNLEQRKALPVPEATPPAGQHNLLRIAYHYDAIQSKRYQSDGGAMPQTMKPEPNEKLVKIFDTRQESEAMVVQGLLESAGVESDLKAIDVVQDVYPGLGGVVILVREEDAEEAAKVIESYRQAPTNDDDTAEITG
jgi:putative signal transducing protein